MKLNRKKILISAVSVSVSVLCLSFAFLFCNGITPNDLFNNLLFEASSSKPSANDSSADSCNIDDAGLSIKETDSGNSDIAETGGPSNAEGLSGGESNGDSSSNDASSINGKNNESGNSSSSSNSSSQHDSNSSNASSASGKQRVWVEPEYKIVHHEAEYRTVNVIVAYVCQCGARFNTHDEWYSHRPKP